MTPRNLQAFGGKEMNSYLVAGAVLSGIAALLHLGCIIFGASWYRFFGAGERMATMAEAGSMQPIIVTMVIAAVLAGWSAYALSGAGVIMQLPLLLPALIAITGIYLVRGVIGLFFIQSSAFGNSSSFWLWSSVICIVFGSVHLLGLIRFWNSP